jgi:hypothetical protein
MPKKTLTPELIVEKLRQIEVLVSQGKTVPSACKEFGLTVYGATKVFFLFLSEGLHLELASKGVYVQAVLSAATRTEIWERAGRDVKTLAAVMEVHELVDAALVGFDRWEIVTIPSLSNVDRWGAFEAARQSMIPSFNQVHTAARYRAVTPDRIAQRILEAVAPGGDAGTDSANDGSGEVREPCLYQLVRQKGDAFRDRIPPFRSTGLRFPVWMFAIETRSQLSSLAGLE